MSREEVGISWGPLRLLSRQGVGNLPAPFSYLSLLMDRPKAIVFETAMDLTASSFRELLMSQTTKFRLLMSCLLGLFPFNRSFAFCQEWSPCSRREGAQRFGRPSAR